MSTLEEAAQQALEALEGFAYHGRSEIWTEAITALRAALAEPVREMPSNSMKFRKKPVVIEATQWFKNGDHPLDYTERHDGRQSPEYRRRENWEGEMVRYYRVPGLDGKAECAYCGGSMNNHGWIDTLEGGHIVCPGDWIITGIKGEHYPVKDEIFRETYEEVKE